MLSTSPILSISLSAVFTFSTLSCTTAQGAQKQPAPNGREAAKSDPKSDQQNPPKIQPEFQDEFARQLAEAGNKAEGWALFSDSSMGHNGQRWIIKKTEGKKTTFTKCVIAQGETACKNSPLTQAQFSKLLPTLNAGDSLKHILPPSFDGVSFEYLHSQSGNPKPTRVVFITSAKPFPAEYESLVKAFK